MQANTAVSKSNVTGRRSLIVIKNLSGKHFLSIKTQSLSERFPTISLRSTNSLLTVGFRKHVAGHLLQSVDVVLVQPLEHEALYPRLNEPANLVNHR
jgi:hypothetical protein